MDMSMNTDIRSYSFPEYLELVESYSKCGLTTGPEQKENFIHYTKLNHNRMKRWVKSIKLNDDTQNVLRAIEGEYKIKVLVESWCGDAAHNLPVIAAMVNGSNSLNMEILLRDENLDLMDMHLTNGGRAIPKAIVEDSKGQFRFNWGPRPGELQEMVMSEKARPTMSNEEFSPRKQLWYNDDKGQSLQREWVYLIKENLD